MKKWTIGLSSFALLLVIGFVLSSRWFWSLPFMPEAWRSNFQLNANIIPASDDSRSLFVAINPGFRAEFGDKENPTNAFLRFEKTGTDQTSSNADVNANLLDSLAFVQLIKDYQPGFEWQLFNVGIDEGQLLGGTTLSEDEEMLKITRELLGEQVVDEPTTDLATVASERENIVTETMVERFQGYDQVANMAVADNIDLKYTVVPGKGITSEIWIGDRKNFDTACLKMLSLTGSDAGCNLPSNKFSFLLQLDNGQRLIHDPLALDDSTHGTYYIVDSDGYFLYRLGNPTLVDATGQTSNTVEMEVRPGQVDGVDVEQFYIVTLTANLGWLIDSDRTFPARISSGFYIDGSELFVNEIENNTEESRETESQESEGSPEPSEEPTAAPSSSPAPTTTPEPIVSPESELTPASPVPEATSSSA